MQPSFNLQENIDALDIGYIAINKKGKITAFNQYAADFYKCTKEIALQSKILDFMPDTKLLFSLESGEILKLQNYLLNGINVSLTVIPLKRKNQIVGVSVLFQELKHPYSLLNNEDVILNLSDNILEAIDVGIIIVNTSGIVIKINKAYKKMIGIYGDEYINKHVDDICAKGYASTALSPLVLNSKTKTSIVDFRNGKELLLTGVPITNNHGEITHVLISARDVTELNILKEKLSISQKKQEEYLNNMNGYKLAFQPIITKTLEMQNIIDLAFRIAQVNSSVLILGESGVGKGMLAQLIHRASKRFEKPFIKINCGAIPPALIESELFGYEPGSFTGANKEGKVGMFELANGGTLFLDEIGDLQLDMQVKVLHAIQEKEIIRVGGKKPIKLDIRIISATNKDLEDMVNNKAFRDDLFYRLNTIPIRIPPLRNRKDDIIPLTHEFIEKFNHRYGYKKWLSPAVINCLFEYDWPGNIRELENTIERVLVTSNTDCVTSETLYAFPPFNNISFSKNCDLKTALETKEKQLISNTYNKTKSSYKTAEILGVSQSCIIKKMKKYGISTNA